MKFQNNTMCIFYFPLHILMIHQPFKQPLHQRIDFPHQFRMPLHPYQIWPGDSFDHTIRSKSFSFQTFCQCIDRLMMKTVDQKRIHFEKLVKITISLQFYTVNDISIIIKGMVDPGSGRNVLDQSTAQGNIDHLHPSAKFPRSTYGFPEPILQIPTNIR